MRTCYLLLVACCLSASAQVAQLRWDVQLDRAVQHDTYVWQGETVDLLPRLVQGTTPVAVTNVPVEFRYREASLATNLYRSVPAACNTNTGELSVRWIPNYDAGAAWYDYQFIVGSNAANPRAFGRITMRPTIGWQASTNPPPAISQYATRADVQALSNALGVAAQDLAALGPRLSLVESGTNAWNTAHGWGDHSAAGYLLSSAWLLWLGTNTYVKAETDPTVDVRIAAAIGSLPPPDRVVTPDGSRWIDATGGVWAVSAAPAGDRVVLAFSDGFGFTPDWTDPPQYRPPQDQYILERDVTTYDGGWQFLLLPKSWREWDVIATFEYSEHQSGYWECFLDEIPGDGPPSGGEGSMGWLVLLPHIETVTNRVGTVALTSQLAPTVTRDGIAYRQYWNTNLLTTAWEALP